MAVCDFTTFTKDRMEKIATQYRESTNLLHLIKGEVIEAKTAGEITCRIPDFFDIDTAVGDQLTKIGKWVGWPREHCQGKRLPVFGFVCPPNVCIGRGHVISGFCTGNWDCNDNPAFGSFEFTDDDMYRRFLKAKVISNDKAYRREDMIEALEAMFGSNAMIFNETPGEMKIATGRLLTDEEVSIAHLFEQVLPVAPGVNLSVWETSKAVFGFGAGWGGFCSGDFPSFVHR